MLAALLGSSPIIVHIESGAAISSGGRTGLTSIVIGQSSFSPRIGDSFPVLQLLKFATVEGCWFLCSVFFAPLLGSVPASAVSPALLLLASSMMSLAHSIKWTEIEEGTTYLIMELLTTFCLLRSLLV